MSAIKKGGMSDTPRTDAASWVAIDQFTDSASVVDCGVSRTYPGDYICAPERLPMPRVSWVPPTQVCEKTVSKIIRYKMTPIALNGRVVYHEALAEGWRRPTCCVCGTPHGLHKDERYGWRCDSDGCMVL